MTEGNLTRRDFVKSLALAGAALPAVTVVGKIGDDELVKSEAFGGFLIRRHAAGDAPYEVDESVYKRFNQKFDVFNRLVWDQQLIDLENSIAANPVDLMMSGETGKTRLDFAFYTAAWTVATTLGSQSGAIGGPHGGLYSLTPLEGSFVSGYPLIPLGPWDWNAEGFSDREATDIVKTAAKFYGASLAGVAQVDERWVYSHSYGGGYTNRPETIGRSAPIVFRDASAPEELEDGTLVIPKSMKRVVAMAFEMDADGIATALGGPASAAVGNGYSRMSFTAGTLAEFIRALGYNAVPCGNNTALSVPIAIDAGLGEFGRHGLLITPKFGPRVRLAKVFTDMPLIADTPISFGATEFCEICGKCAENCPGEAIPSGRNARTYEGRNGSSNPGVYKWYVDCEKCHQVWTSNGMDCANCIRSCPFNKPQGWLHDATRALITMGSGVVDQAVLSLDDASQFGEQKDARQFWNGKDEFVHFKNA